MIYVDIHEPKKIKEGLQGYGAKEENLHFGDYAFMGNGPDGKVLVGIERKSITDLINSIISGRLSGHQLPGLTKTFEYPYLLVEGIWKLDYEGRVMILRGPNNWATHNILGAALWNYFNTITWFARVVVVRVGTPTETISWIKAAYNWWMKEWEDHDALQDARIRLRAAGPWGTPLNLTTRMAAQLDGVGVKRAIEVARQFPSPRSMVNADENEWLEINGIGRKLARESVKACKGD